MSEEYRRLIVKDIIMQRDIREENILEKDLDGNPIKFKQSEYTCNIILKDLNNNEYRWVANFPELAKAMELIAKNEEGKYNNIPEKEIAEFPSGKFLLGRNMSFLAWLYPIYDWYLKKFGFNPPQKHLDKAEKNKHGNRN